MAPLCHTHSDIGVRQMVQTKWQDLNSWGTGQKHNKQKTVMKRAFILPFSLYFVNNTIIFILCHLFFFFVLLHNQVSHSAAVTMTAPAPVLLLYCLCKQSVCLWQWRGRLQGSHWEQQMPGLLQGGWRACRHGRQVQDAKKLRQKGNL